LPEVEAIIADCIVNFHDTEQSTSDAATAQEIRRLCSNANLPLPALNTIRARLIASNGRKRVAKRNGEAAAHDQFDPIKGSIPDSEWPLSLVQMDHTLLPVIIVDDVHRKSIRRVWITLAIDVYSRVCLGMYLSLDPPSAMSAGMCVSHAILPKERWMVRMGVTSTDWPCWGVMGILHMDNAKEFRGDMLNLACKEHDIDLHLRPVKKPRYGAHIERLMGTVSEGLKSVKGATFSGPDEKGEYDSEGNACMTFSELEKWLVLFFAQYHRRVHGGIGTTPLTKWRGGQDQSLWPVRPRPLPDELLSSWLVRLAHSHGLKTQTFCHLIFGGALQVWNRDIDRLAPSWLLQELQRRTGTSYEDVSKTTLRVYENRLYRKFRTAGVLPWILNLQMYHRKRAGFGLQFCSLCLRNDHVPYFRKLWRVALSTVCPNSRKFASRPLPELSRIYRFLHRTDMRGQIINGQLIGCCHACGFELADSHVVQPEFYDDHFAAVLAAACAAVQGGGSPTSEWDLGRLHTLRHLSHILTSRYLHVQLRQFVLRKLSVPDVQLTVGRLPIEMRSIRERHHLIQVAAWLFVDIRARITQAWYEGAVRQNILLKDFDHAPDWYRNIIEELPNWRARLQR
jgi:transposase InsO family protein